MYDGATIACINCSFEPNIHINNIEVPAYGQAIIYTWRSGREYHTYSPAYGARTSETTELHIYD